MRFSDGSDAETNDQGDTANSDRSPTLGNQGSHRASTICAGLECQAKRRRNARDDWLTAPFAST